MTHAISSIWENNIPLLDYTRTIAADVRRKIIKIGNISDYTDPTGCNHVVKIYFYWIINIIRLKKVDYFIVLLKNRRKTWME